MTSFAARSVSLLFMCCDSSIFSCSLSRGLDRGIPSKSECQLHGRHCFYEVRSPFSASSKIADSGPTSSRVSTCSLTSAQSVLMVSVLRQSLTSYRAWGLLTLVGTHRESVFHCLCVELAVALVKASFKILSVPSKQLVM